MNNPPATYADTFEHVMDEKSRVSVPAEWRDDGYEQRVFLFPSREGCLRAYPASWMSKKQESLAGLPLNDSRRKIIESAFSQAQKVVFDAQGRMKICDRLIAHASLGKQIILAGAFDHFQIWDASAWKSKKHGQTTIEDLEL